MPINYSQLRILLTNHFNDSELHTLCFDLAIDYESLSGQGKADKARELVDYVKRHQREEDLLTECRKLRPNINWSVVTYSLSKPKQVSISSELKQPGTPKNILEVPEEIMSTIKAQAERTFPSDFSTCKYQIDKEVQAWRKIQAYEARTLPDEILQGIMHRSAQAFPTDFSTQLYQIDKEVEAWHKLQTLRFDDIPTEVVKTIVEKASKDFSDDFSTRHYVINREAEAWRKLNE